jgi:predicted metalloprotease with PDZ domain
MINLFLECRTPTSQFVEITLQIPLDTSGTVKLQLPAWRAGRYQLANYAQNIRSLRILDDQNHAVSYEKSTKNAWIFEGQAKTVYSINYEYYAAKMDAGSCWIDEEQVYINFINCAFQVIGMENSPIQVSCSFPQFPKQICTLSHVNASTYQADDFQQLVDSTFLAAKQLTNWTYQVSGTAFKIWIHGAIHFDPNLLIIRFKKFTATQIQDFGEFPEKEYHFIFQLLPYPHYHGVEHRKGTVITFGPAENLSNESQMDELLGVSSHELYHAWNVCRIRPTELLPYDFSKETYTKAGWMLEGITTYMGDLYLLKSKVFSLPNYLKQLEKLIHRNALSFGWENHSILESSFDLWLDGYQQGIPDRKVSIYTHGALICICLDLMLLERGSSFPTVMKKAWQTFGKPSYGYSAKLFWQLIIEDVDDKEVFEDFYQTYISCKNDILGEVKRMLPIIGFELTQIKNTEKIASELGLILSEKKVIRIHSASPVYDKVMIGDEVQTNEVENEIHLIIKRINGTLFEINSVQKGNNFYPTYGLKDIGSTEIRKTWLA